MSDTPNIDIRPDHWQIVRDILRKHVPQYEVWAFGSRAKWLAKQYSDLDLAIITDRPLSLAISAALADDFSESDLPWKVDVVDWATTGESFRKIIERDKVVVQEPKNNGLAVKSDWREVLLGEVIELKRGYDLPKQERKFGSVPVVSSSGISAFHAEAMVKSPGVVTGRYGTIGQVFFIDGPDFWPLNTTLYVRDFKGNDPRFISYLLRTLDFRAYSDKAAVPGVNRNDLHQARVRIPTEIEEQLAIARILGSLDDKIELSQRMSQTLEAMARALFKSWFVDFDGVPPEDMQESEMGLIPKGWRAASLDSIAHYLNGLALQKFPPESEIEFLPVIKIAQLRAGNAQNADKASARLKSEYIVQDGDVLFSWSGTLEVEVWTGGRGALNQHLFKVTSTEVPKWFYYFATREHLPDFRTIAAGKATTMGHIQRKHLADAKVAVPPTDAMGKFDRTIAPLFEQVINNALQSRTLAQQRDILLPKLISGDFRVRDVKCFLEKAE